MDIDTILETSIYVGLGYATLNFAWKKLLNRVFKYEFHENLQYVVDQHYDLAQPESTQKRDLAYLKSNLQFYTKKDPTKLPVVLTEKIDNNLYLKINFHEVMGNYLEKKITVPSLASAVVSEISNYTKEKVSSFKQQSQ